MVSGLLDLGYQPTQIAEILRCYVRHSPPLGQYEGEALPRDPGRRR
jgi:hypothetical protein